MMHSVARLACRNCMNYSLMNVCGYQYMSWPKIERPTLEDFLRWQSKPAAIAQLGERQIEDLKVPSSILGLGMFPPAPAPRVGLGGRNLSCGGGQGGCKACVFADPAACPLHAAPCYLGPRQRAGARRRGAGEGGGEPSRRHARWTPQASAWVERATAGGAFRARRAQSHKAAAYWIA